VHEAACPLSCCSVSPRELLTSHRKVNLFSLFCYCVPFVPVSSSVSGISMRLLGESALFCYSISTTAGERAVNKGDLEQRRAFETTRSDKDLALHESETLVALRAPADANSSYRVYENLNRRSDDAYTRI